MLFFINRLPQRIIVVFFVLLNFDGYSQRTRQTDKLAYADSLLKQGIKIKDSLLIAEAYYLLGKAEYFRFNFKKSNEYFYKSLNIIEKKGDSYEYGRLYLRLSENDTRMGNYNDCLKHINRAMEIFEGIHSEKGLLAGYMMLAEARRRPWGVKNETSFVDANFDKAIYYLKKAEKLAIRLNDTTGLAQIRHSIGNCFASLDDYNSISYFKESLKIYNSHDMTVPKVNVMMNLTETYIKFNQLKEAYKMLKELEIFVEKKISNDNGMRLHFEGVYANYCQAVNDFKCALEHFKKREFFLNKLLTADREGAVSRLNIQYETQKKQELLDRQKTELLLKDRNLSLQRKSIIVISLLLIFALSLCFFLYKLYQKNKQISKKNAILIQEQNHRVKNNLQVISSLLRLQSNQIEDKRARQAVDESQLRIESMAVLHRQLYDNDQPDSINMEVFIEQLSAIIFSSYGLTNIKQDYTITVYEMQVDKAIYVGLMLNELISNACKYAFNAHPNPILAITLTETDKEVILAVNDNGNKEFVNSENKNSFGMKLIDMMVQQLYGSYETRFNNGFEFIMRFK
ncbi:histidine kinase dimerization/phosphoacceptor domain -containing protein [Emticicia agri]|uniref:histidine kinase n=1 Tax=Emticicia agri TaxID=2492393 RepID=A0A4Q5LZV7_9BACT|nr:histidine kinase dimerization/phosphoacceptor domain -containing protein [Emticicia agri]RYU95536.1 hypothetical protein EWM59_11620 [Emticicia agri]